MSMTAIRSLQRTPAAAGLEPVLAALQQDGGVIVEGMFPVDTIAQIRAAADDFAEGEEPGGATQGLGDDGKGFVGANTIRFSSLARLTPAFFDVLDNELYAQIADAVLLPICGSYWLNTAQVMYIGPGESAQMLHRDANNWWAFVRATWPDSPEVTISAMIGLEEVTEELGATRVVPGSHRQSEIARYEERESVPAELGPGDALVYSGYVLHGGGANQTVDRWRRAFHCSFVAGWLTPEEASPLDFGLGELSGYSERVQRLLGHSSYDPRPYNGGGLWLRHAREMQDVIGSNGDDG
ncbi:phytanoyl-CoA dioxygenase family protein [Candidatus Poriferisodalis sp.]|uniref:phytanoyl-CoA dioxygenase family protein n=1 Tax=Candidatus Poriferisodalis sp. TaxID=3101277 RepID=UPI003B5252AF